MGQGVYGVWRTGQSGEDGGREGHGVVLGGGGGKRCARVVGDRGEGKLGAIKEIVVGACASPSHTATVSFGASVAALLVEL